MKSLLLRHTLRLSSSFVFLLRCGCQSYSCGIVGFLCGFLAKFNHLRQIRNSTIKCQYSGIPGTRETQRRVGKCFLRLTTPQVGIGFHVEKMVHVTWKGALFGLTAKTSFAIDCRRHENFHVGLYSGWVFFFFCNWKIPWAVSFLN